MPAVLCWWEEGGNEGGVTVWLRKDGDVMT